MFVLKGDEERTEVEGEIGIRNYCLINIQVLEIEYYFINTHCILEFAEPNIPYDKQKEFEGSEYLKKLQEMEDDYEEDIEVLFSIFHIILLKEK